MTPRRGESTLFHILQAPFDHENWSIIDFKIGKHVRSVFKKILTPFKEPCELSLIACVIFKVPNVLIHDIYDGLGWSQSEVLYLPFRLGQCAAWVPNPPVEQKKIGKTIPPPVEARKTKSDHPGGGLCSVPTHARLNCAASDFFAAHLIFMPPTVPGSHPALLPLLSSSDF